VFENCPLIDY